MSVFVSYVEYAPWLRRLGAYAVDYCILALGMGLALIPARSLTPAGSDVPAMVAFAYFLAAPAVYFTVWHGRSGRTLGKQAFGISVVDAETRAPIGYVRALVRQLSSTILWMLFTIPGIIDGVWPFMNDRRQALHDLVARSIVVDDRLTATRERPLRDRSRITA